MRLFRLILIAVLFCTLTFSCSGIFDDIYGDAPADTSFEEGFRSSSSPEYFTLMLNATNYDEWIYINLHNRTIERKPIPRTLSEDQQWDGRSGLTYHLVEGDKYTKLSTTRSNKQEEPEEWDLAIHHFDVRTNGGKAAVALSNNLIEIVNEDLSKLKFESDSWTTHQVIVDMREMMGFKIGYQNIAVNLTLTQWATMDFSTPPPIYSKSNNAYIVQFPDGSTAALKLRSYMSPVGTKGYLTIDIIYPI